MQFLKIQQFFFFFLFFFNDTATTEIYTLSLHDALPISVGRVRSFSASLPTQRAAGSGDAERRRASVIAAACNRGLRLPTPRRPQVTPFLTKLRSSLAARSTSGWHLDQTTPDE